MTPGEIEAFRAAVAQMTRDLACSLIDWDAVQAACETSGTPEGFEQLIDIAIEELRAAKGFRWPTVGGVT